MAKTSPTKRSLDLLRKDGWPLVAVVEHWNPHAFVRQDLFGIIDVLAVRGNETLAVQVTSASNVSARIKKMSESDALPVLREAGWTVLVHGWKKNKQGRWECRVEDIS